MNSSLRLALPVAVAGVLGLPVAAASADPVHAPDATRVTIVCDNGHTYDAVVNGEGDFSPAHDLGSNTMLIPTAFGEATFTVTDANGNVLDTESEPASSKGRATKHRSTSTECTYSFSGTFEDPEVGTVTFSGEGSVTGFTTPAKRH